MATTRVDDRIEMALLAVTGYACHLFYNPVGYLASLAGSDHAHAIATRLDASLPFAPFWVLFYQLAYFVPLGALLLMVLARRSDVRLVRRAFAAFVALLALHYALYLSFPVSASALRVPLDRLGPGLLDRLVRYQYAVATPWNACPSLHVSACWYFYRLFARTFPRWRGLYLAWFVGMVIGTVAIKIHFALDGLTGLALGEAAFRLFRRLELADRLAAAWPSRGRLVAVYATATLALGVALALLIQEVGYDGPLYVMTGRPR